MSVAEMVVFPFKALLGGNSSLRYYDAQAGENYGDDQSAELDDVVGYAE